MIMDITSNVNYKGEQALKQIFKDGSLLRDEDNFVGFLEHNYVFGSCYDNGLAIGSIDNHTEWLLTYVRSCFADDNVNDRPDVREVWHEFYGRRVQVTYGKLPWDWSPQPSH